jgi:general secretion pathway protein F
MPTYRYKAMTTAGTITTGALDASSQHEAILQIRKLGHFPIEASTGSDSGWRTLVPDGLWPERLIAPRAIASATLALSALLEAGLPLDRALAFVAELEQSPAMRRGLGRVLAEVRGGARFADACERTGSFPKSYVAMVRAGEHGGNLTTTLGRLADYLSRASAIRETVISALVYPALLLCTAGVSIIIVLVFVLPQFVPLFLQSGKPLPWTTQLVMAAGAFLSDYGWLLLIAAAAGFLAFRRAMSVATLRLGLDRLKLRVPLFGDLLRKIQIERFSRTLGTLVANGVTLPQALAITGSTLSNSEFADAVKDTATRIKEGERLASLLRKSGVFPAVSLDLIRVGEETGALDEMLLRQADLYERDVRHSVDRLLTMMVPLLTVFMGGIVAALIGSLLLAVQSINDLAL